MQRTIQQNAWKKIDGRGLDHIVATVLYENTDRMRKSAPRRSHAPTPRTRWVGTAQELLLAIFPTSKGVSLSTNDLVEALQRRGHHVPTPSIYRALNSLSRAQFLMSEGTPKRYLLSPSGRALANLARILQSHREPNRHIRSLANECYDALANA